MGLQDMWLKKADNERSEFINKCIEWDTPRLANEVCPEGVTVLQDIIYDETKGEYGLLDIYFPGTQQEGFDEAFFLIHGGAFVYGSKELDKNYGMHLALKSGLPVINVNYTLMPETDLAGEAEECDSEFILMYRKKNISKLGCILHTGRLHQIRATLFSLGFPVVGDKLYGLDDRIFDRFADGRMTESDRKLLILERQALHAYELELTDPFDGSRKKFSSPIPEELSSIESC